MVKIGNIIVYVLFIFCAQELYSQEETYEFYGRHFVVSYRNCDSAALENIQLLLKAFREAVEVIPIAFVCLIQKDDETINPFDPASFLILLNSIRLKL